MSGVGVLATIRDGRPHPIPILFAYDEPRDALYLHSGKGGQIRVNLEAGEERPQKAGEPEPSGPRVALTCFEMGRLLPAREAMEFGVEYASVMVFGTARVVEDEAEAEQGLQLIMDKYAPHLRPGRDYQPIPEADVKRTSVYRLDIEAWSGKQKTAEPDFPGAYWFADVRRDPGSG
jgi:nitroimidazol reductase NimA-like FMN-containing flavoprotein (pyridoxamine 5'-phosphate oxidase superfamily)